MAPAERMALWAEVSAVATICYVIVTALLAVVAVFQDRIRSWLRRPKLRVEWGTQPPFFIRIPIESRILTVEEGPSGPGRVLREQMIGSVGCYYSRLKVFNWGNDRAEQVEVFAEALERWDQKQGRFEPVEAFLPMNLLWSHLEVPVRPVIPPDTGRFCDLGKVVEPAKRAQIPGEAPPADAGVGDDEALFTLKVATPPTTRGHLLTAGRYALKISVTAANMPGPVHEWRELHFPGKWFERPEDMYSTGLKIERAARPSAPA